VSGVMTTEACGSYAYDSLDHCVQLTGYDLDAEEPYYIVSHDDDDDDDDGGGGDEDDEDDDDEVAMLLDMTRWRWTTRTLHHESRSTESMRIHPTAAHRDGVRPAQVRNSWATNWGMEGFILLSATANTCGLADEATFVDVVVPSV
jgi:hypothetical protein